MLVNSFFIGLRKSVLSRPFCGYDLKNNVSFKKKSALVQNRRWIMSILDVCCLSETKTFEQFSDFLAFTLSSKNSHQFGQNQLTDKFHHSIESWEWGEEDRTWAGGLRRLWRPPKRRNISLPNSLATVVYNDFQRPGFMSSILLVYVRIFNQWLSCLNWTEILNV